MDRLVFLVAVVLVVAAEALIVAGALAARRRGRRRGGVEDLSWVLAPAVGLAVLLWLGWRSVAG
ncbi:MAG: hypothetical protein ACE5KX_06675 [Acidimicrobiia bacterium]